MTPPHSYPGKLAKFLYERYKHFNLHGLKHIIVAGKVRRQHKGSMGSVQYSYFSLFVRLLVIREDDLIVTGEPFALWVIESGKDISEELPLVKAGLPVIFTDNQKPYKQRKDKDC